MVTFGQSALKSANLEILGLVVLTNIAVLILVLLFKPAGRRELAHHHRLGLGKAGHGLLTTLGAFGAIKVDQLGVVDVLTRLNGR